MNVTMNKLLTANGLKHETFLKHKYDFYRANNLLALMELIKWFDANYNIITCCFTKPIDFEDQ